jgi:hypothetical protein
MKFNIPMKMAVFWVVAPCSLVDVYQRFRGPCCLHHQGDSSCYFRLNEKRRTKMSDAEGKENHAIKA